MVGWRYQWWVTRRDLPRGRKLWPSSVGDQKRVSLTLGAGLMGQQCQHLNTTYFLGYVSFKYRSFSVALLVTLTRPVSSLAWGYQPQIDLKIWKDAI